MVSARITYDGAGTFVIRYLHAVYGRDTLVYPVRLSSLQFFHYDLLPAGVRANLTFVRQNSKDATPLDGAVR